MIYMVSAAFGIENNGLNLFVNLLIFFAIVIWLALVYWTYSDARRRIDDPLLVGCATVAALFPFIGPLVYTIVRPPEYLEDSQERELEIKAAQSKLRKLERQLCPNCNYAVEPTFLRCPSCMFKLKDPCGTCGKPVDPSWRACPFCETPMAAARQGRRAGLKEQRGDRATKQPSKLRPKKGTEGTEAGRGGGYSTDRNKRPAAGEVVGKRDASAPGGKHRTEELGKKSPGKGGRRDRDR